MIRDVEQTRDAIADALWWLKGFAAARREDHARGEVEEMADRLSAARDYLARLADGRAVFVAKDRIVVSPHLVESMSDLLYPDANRPAAEEVTPTRSEVKRVIDKHNHEHAAIDDGDEIPF